MMSLTFQRNACVLSFLVLTAASEAQDVRIETQQQARTRERNALAKQDQTESVIDPELGDISVVSRQPRPTMFTFSTGQSLNYSSNAFFVGDGGRIDFVCNGGV